MLFSFFMSKGLFYQNNTWSWRRSAWLQSTSLMFSEYCSLMFWEYGSLMFWEYGLLMFWEYGSLMFWCFWEYCSLMFWCFWEYCSLMFWYFWDYCSLMFWYFWDYCSLMFWCFWEYLAEEVQAKGPSHGQHWLSDFAHGAATLQPPRNSCSCPQRGSRCWSTYHSVQTWLQTTFFSKGEGNFCRLPHGWPGHHQWEEPVLQHPL